jgi:PIN domain nuclease of toxin-antitoxin system
MKLLLDTHLILWGGEEPERLSKVAVRMITDPVNTLYFSAVNIWEVAIKRAAQPDRFSADPHALRTALLDSGYEELAVTSLHAVSVAKLPLLHRDPFDRILLAQAMVEGATLLTSDTKLTQYKGPILKV